MYKSYCVSVSCSNSSEEYSCCNEHFFVDDLEQGIQIYNEYKQQSYLTVTLYDMINKIYIFDFI